MTPRIKVVLCGSFHGSPEMLAKQFVELEMTGCRILSPLSLDFWDNSNEFVMSRTEISYSPEEIEKYHLKAMREADFIWLYAPQGYVGSSTAFELGFAYCLAKPIFCKCLPKDTWLESITTKVTSVFDAIEASINKS
jgi:hypothetical protein